MISFCSSRDEMGFIVPMKMAKTKRTTISRRMKNTLGDISNSGGRRFLPLAVEKRNNYSRVSGDRKNESTTATTKTTFSTTVTSSTTTTSTKSTVAKNNKPTARTRYENLRNLQQFSPARTYVTSVSPDIARLWIQMGEEKSSPIDFSLPIFGASSKTSSNDHSWKHRCDMSDEDTNKKFSNKIPSLSLRQQKQQQYLHHFMTNHQAKQHQNVTTISTTTTRTKPKSVDLEKFGVWTRVTNENPNRVSAGSARRSIQSAREIQYQNSMQHFSNKNRGSIEACDSFGVGRNERRGREEDGHPHHHAAREQTATTTTIRNNHLNNSTSTTSNAAGTTSRTKRNLIAPNQDQTVHSNTKHPNSTTASNPGRDFERDQDRILQEQSITRANSKHRWRRSLNNKKQQNKTMTKGGCPWKSAVDPRTGRTYYYHEVTRETQWRKPMELASDDEKRAMEEKERRQKDFFAAMEANILSSMSQGQVPGDNKSKAQNQNDVGKPQRPADDKPRPELIRTISAMDETVLRDLIRRVPSHRNVTKSDSLNPAELERPAFGGDGRNYSFVSTLDPLAESTREFGHESIFDGLPNEGNNSDSDEGSINMDMAPGNMSVKSTRSDAGKFNESSISGFGLSWEETAALKKLAAITKEMVNVEKEEETTTGRDGLQDMKDQFKGLSTGGGQRELPRELDFDEDSEDSDDSSLGEEKIEEEPKPSGVQKQRALPRELDFDDDSDSDAEPTPVVETKKAAVRKSSKKMVDITFRPEVKRRNTCGTIYVGSTMSAPDKDATIKCVCGVYRAHIMSSENSIARNSLKYKVFNDIGGSSVADGISWNPSSNHSPSNQQQLPSLDEICSFYRDTFLKAQMESDCIIMSLIYVERLIKETFGELRPRACNWRSLLFSCMILSSKVWDDLSMWNADFSQSCPPGVSFPLQRINELELAILNALGFQVKVPASEYAKYYFLLRSMLIKSGLGGESLNALNPLDVDGARRLQQMSSQFENVAQTKSKINGELTSRSKSLQVGRTKISDGMFQTANKVSLEHMVEM